MARTTIYDKIRQIIKEPLAKPTTLEQSFNVYDFTQDGRHNIETVRQFVRDLITTEAVLEDSATRVLTHENCRALKKWAKDKRSFNFQDGIELETNRQITPEELDDVEDEIRSSIMDKQYQYFFSQLLICGYSVVSCGLTSDVMFVPDSRKCNIDYCDGQFVTIEREIDGWALNEIVQTWQSEIEVDDYEPMTKDNWETCEIIHGQFQISRDEYIEFIQYEDVIYTKINPHSVIYFQIYEVDADKGHPMGIYGICLGEESQIIKVQNAIASRIGEGISASFIIPDGTMPDETVNDLRSGATITYNPERAPGTPANTSNTPPFYFVPHRMEEIQQFTLEWERLMTKCRQKTGLYLRPATYSTGDKSASEALLVYQNATEVHREIIDNFSKIFGMLMKVLIMRDYNIQCEVRITNNPLDQERRIAEIKEGLPNVLASMQNDPMVSGSIYAPRTVYELQLELFRHAGVDLDVLANPQESAQQYQEGLMKKQQEERDYKQKIADAELGKAQSEILGKQIEMEKVRIQASELAWKKEEHNEKMLLELIKLREGEQSEERKLSVSLLERLMNERDKENDKENDKETENVKSE